MSLTRLKYSVFFKRLFLSAIGTNAVFRYACFECVARFRFFTFGFCHNQPPKAAFFGGFIYSSCPKYGTDRIILIDWELNELARNIMKSDKNADSVEGKIKQKFFDFMKKRDLYFFMGTHFRFGSWLIVGIFYPDRAAREQQKLQL